jgi:cell division protein FtsB
VALRWSTAGLLALLALVQAQLWFGDGGKPNVINLQLQLGRQQIANDEARARNARLEAEVRDLREGLEMVEEKARYELGMVKPDEILVQVAPAKR